MIQTHSNDPDVSQAAAEALVIITRTLASLPNAESFDYGGHTLRLDEYGVCTRCSTAIAEAQAAERVIRLEIDLLDDALIKEHLELAAELFRLEAQAATARAQFHNGHGTEAILNKLLAFQYERHIGDDYQHSHDGGDA
jgi:hypothetical protein